MPEKKIDNIFENTTKGKKKTARAKGDRKTVKKAAASSKADNLEIDRFKVLSDSLTSHHNEVIYRKGKEDRILFWASGLIMAVALVSFLVLYGHSGVSLFVRLVLKILLCLGIGLIALFAGSLLENNRKKIRDVIALLVKINEKFELFKEGAYDKSEEPFYPDSYRFAGSESEDEANNKSLFLKGMAIFAVILILFLF